MHSEHLFCDFPHCVFENSLLILSESQARHFFVDIGNFVSGENEMYERVYKNRLVNGEGGGGGGFGWNFETVEQY